MRRFFSIPQTMIDYAILPMYLVAVLALLLVPGPDMLLILSASLSFGRRVGIFASLGNATSGLILTCLAAVGVSALVAVSPLALELLHAIGGLYLLKMGWDCYHAEVSAAPSVTSSQGLASQFYRRAMLSNLLNPKALLFFVMFLPQFVSAHISSSSAQQMFALGIILNVLGLSFNLILVALVGSLGKGLLHNATFRRYQYKVMGAVFFTLAIWLLSGLL